MNIEEMVKMIEEEFVNGQVKQIDWKELIRKLKEKGLVRIDVDDALDEAERHKIIMLDRGFYKWVDPSVREMEIAKTQKYFQMLAEIFKEGRIEFLPRESHKASLRERGLNDEEITRVIAEAERDHVLDFYVETFGPDNTPVDGCSWILPEERQREAEAEKDSRRFSEKWYKKKAMQEDIWKE